MEIELLRERPGPRSSASLWRCGGRDDPRYGALFRHPAGRSRSALYARRARAHHRLGAGPARRGPVPRQSDAQLLAVIRADLARSPFHGEGHRKVHARLRILDGIRVARTRVLRVMRAHGLLSPHRGRQGAAKTHDGRVITQAPNVMWGRTACGYSHSTTGGAGSSRRSNTGTRSAWGGTCAKSGAASRHSIRLRKGSNVSMARWTPTSPVGWRFGWITVVSTCQTTSSSRSGIGGSTPASALSRNRKRTVWRSGGIVRSRSKRSTAESFRTSRPSAPPWPTSWSGTTRPGVSRSLGITRRSRRARSMSYARRRIAQMCVQGTGCGTQSHAGNVRLAL